MRKLLYFLFIMFFGACNFFWGDKQDATTDEIFEQGKIDPELIPQSIGYVPVLPFFEGFSNPIDVYVGYDEMIYIIDDFGIHVLDKAGRRFRTFTISGAKRLVQDRRLHTYVSGTLKIKSGGLDYEVAAVYHLINTATLANPEIIDTILHPFSDISRRFTSFRANEDAAVKFTGIATLADNSLYIARSGPNNSATSISYPDNTILIYNKDGNHIGHSNGLSPSFPSIKSSYKITAIAGFSGPPQRNFGISNSRDFFIAQYDSINPVEFGVIGISYLFDPDLGSLYDGRPQMLNYDSSKSKRFLYEPFRFKKPEHIYIAPDQNTYIFVVDSQRDSIYQFTPLGFEGVNPPANYPERKQIIASFGGNGSGPFNFKQPMGICYNNRMIYVADKGNNRICRYKLSTDIE